MCEVKVRKVVLEMKSHGFSGKMVSDAHELVLDLVGKVPLFSQSPSISSPSKPRKRKRESDPKLMPEAMDVLKALRAAR